MVSIMNIIYGGRLPNERRKEPMQVLCVGISRSGTESLREALLKLGFAHTYHGWDTVIPPRFQLQAWYDLCVKKYSDPSVPITAADFDRIIGHCVAITDLPASVFAHELIAAYPDAKVILNRRDDLEAWYHSFDTTMGVFARNPVNFDWVLSWFCRDLFWVRQCMHRTMVPRFFRGSFEKYGRQVYQDHLDSIRSVKLPAERFLEWRVEDGWAPLCKFLNKPIPDEPFPAGNTPADWEKRVKSVFIRYYATAIINLSLLLGVVAVATAYILGS